MTIQKAQTAVKKAETQTAKARESLVKAIILEAGAKPRNVKSIEVTGVRSLVRAIVSI